MSYCRFAWYGSDVYVFESERGIECCGCHLDGDFVCGTPEEMIVHLGRHRRVGEFVPLFAIERLWCDVPGPDEPVTPEPPSLTEARSISARIQREVAGEMAAEYSHL